MRPGASMPTSTQMAPSTCERSRVSRSCNWLLFRQLQLRGDQLGRLSCRGEGIPGFDVRSVGGGVGRSARRTFLFDQRKFQVFVREQLRWLSSVAGARELSRVLGRSPQGRRRRGSGQLYRKLVQQTGQGPWSGKRTRRIVILGADGATGGELDPAVGSRDQERN